MKDKENKTDKGADNEKDLPGYRPYKESEDIYNNEQRVPDINPDDNSEITELNDGAGIKNENSDDRSGGDLDVPGAELDDADEAIGEEDEENNSYSIGGDNHIDLEEDDADRPSE